MSMELFETQLGPTFVRTDSDGSLVDVRGQ
jgi:hypothetical protein